MLPRVGMLSFFYDREQSAWGLIRSIRKDSVSGIFRKYRELVRTTEPEPSGFSSLVFFRAIPGRSLILPQSRQGTYFSSVRIANNIALPRKTGWPGSNSIKY